MRLSISSRAAHVDLEHLQRGRGDGPRDPALGFFLRVVADEIDEIVGDAGRAPGASGDLRAPSSSSSTLSRWQDRRDDAEQRRGIVIVEARLEGEAAAQRRGEQTGTGGGADEGEFGQAQPHAARVRTLVDHDGEPVILPLPS